MAHKTAANWIGYVMSALVVLALLADAGTQLFAPHLLKEPMDATGFLPSLAVPLGIIMLVRRSLCDSADSVSRRDSNHGFSRRRDLRPLPAR